MTTGLAACLSFVSASSTYCLIYMFFYFDKILETDRKIKKKYLTPKPLEIVDI